MIRCCPPRPMRWNAATGAIARCNATSIACARKCRSVHALRWTCGGKPKPKAVNKPSPHSIMHGLDKLGVFTTVSKCMGLPPWCVLCCADYLTRGAPYEAKPHKLGKLPASLLLLRFHGVFARREDGANQQDVHVLEHRLGEQRRKCNHQGDKLAGHAQPPLTFLGGNRQELTCPAFSFQRP